MKSETTEVIFAVYNDPEFPHHYEELKECSAYVTPMTTYWDNYGSFIEFAQEIFIDYGMGLTFDEFRSLMKAKFEETAGTILLSECPDLDPKSVFNGEIPDKLSGLWSKVPIKFPSFRNPELYNHYKRKLNYWDFEKYYKIRGLAIKEEQWREKFKDFKKIEERYFYKYVTNFVIPDKIMNSLENAFLGSPNKTFWPLMTNIVSDPEVREDPEYPLICAGDLLRIEYLTSFILDAEAEKRALDRFAGQFMKYTVDDIKKWKTEIAKVNSKYKSIFDKVDKLKVRE